MDILCEHRTYTDRSFTHQHDYAQLILPLQGTLNIQTQSHKLILDNQHLFFLPPDDVHSFYSTDRNEFLVVNIPFTLFPQLSKSNAQMYQLLDNRWQAIRLLVSNEVTSKRQPDSNSGLTDLIRYASQFLLREATPASIQYIHEHYHEKITIEQLASLEHFNVSYFGSWFYKKTGLTPNVYIQKVRFNRAKNLLCQTNLSIFQIAQLVGYEQQASLTRLFKKYAGVSPKNFRKKPK